MEREPNGRYTRGFREEAVKMVTDGSVKCLVSTIDDRPQLKISLTNKIILRYNLITKKEALIKGNRLKAIKGEADGR